MICTSVAEKDAQGVIEAIRGFEFAEVRLDALSKNIDDEGIMRIFSLPAKLIATCRPSPTISDEQRERILHKAIDSGAAYVDIEVESADVYVDRLIKAARKKGCKVIISYHDHSRTPPREELVRIIEWCSEKKPDLIKIACLSDSNEDNARLLGLLDSRAKSPGMVVIGMGEKGKITRIVAPLLGAAFTFASNGDGKETAPGQIDAVGLRSIIQAIEKSLKC